MGGPNINIDSQEGLEDFFLSSPNLDFYILGEGERKFYALVRSLIEGHGTPDWGRLPSSVLGFDRKKKILLGGQSPT